MGDSLCHLHHKLLRHCADCLYEQRIELIGIIKMLFRILPQPEEFHQLIKVIQKYGISWENEDSKDNNVGL